MPSPWPFGGPNDRPRKSKSRMRFRGGSSELKPLWIVLGCPKKQFISGFMKINLQGSHITKLIGTYGFGCLSSKHGCENTDGPAPAIC